MDYFDFFHPPFSSLATIVANGLSVNQILLRRSPPFRERAADNLGYARNLNIGLVYSCKYIKLFRKRIKVFLFYTNLFPSRKTTIK
jgi:hypothetical protein